MDRHTVTNGHLTVEIRALGANRPDFPTTRINPQHPFRSTTRWRLG